MYFATLRYDSQSDAFYSMLFSGLNHTHWCKRCKRIYFSYCSVVLRACSSVFSDFKLTVLSLGNCLNFTHFSSHMARLQRSYWLQEVLNLQYDTWGYFTSARRLAESSFICCIEPENNQKRYDTKNWQIGSCLKVCFWGEMFIVFFYYLIADRHGLNEHLFRVKLYLLAVHCDVQVLWTMLIR